MLSRDQILGHKKLKQEVVDVPEWEGSVVVRELTANEADAFESMFAGVRPSRNGNEPETPQVRQFRAKLVAMSVIDEAGNRLFSDGDVVALGEMSRAALDRVSTVAMRLSGYSDDGKKNSQPSADSTTASP